MKYYPYFLWLLTGLSICTNTQGQRYDGVVNDASVHRSFLKEDEDITKSILDDLSNLNLLEYAHALPELYPLVESGAITASQWKLFIDSLEGQVRIHQSDTLLPYWGVDYLGLIPLQTQFFLTTIDVNERLNVLYPNAYKILRDNTSSMEGLGYEAKDYDSLLVLSDVAGESNFWFFLQLEGCKLVREVISKRDDWMNSAKARMRGIRLVSTYKTPYVLQMRKWNSLQYRLLNSGDSLCVKFHRPADNVLVVLQESKGKRYYTEALAEGIDRNKTKEF